MRTEPNSLIVRHRLAYLLATFGLMVAMLLPATVSAQWKDDPTEEPEEETVPYDPEDHGYLGRRAYESPQYGYLIDWSRIWAIDEYYDTPIWSDEETGQDTVRLIWTSEDGDEAWLTITGQSDNRGGPDGDVDEWTDPEYIDWQWDNPDYEVEVLYDDSDRTSGAVLYSLLDTSDNDTLWYIIYQSTELDDGTTIYFNFTIYSEIFEDAYEAAGDVLVDDEPYLQFLDWDDIEDAL